MPQTRADLFKIFFTALCVAVICIWTVFVSGCGYAKHKDPELFYESSPRAAAEAARLHAREIGGSYHQNICCGSMQPLIFKGDYIVVEPSPYNDDLLGQAVVYLPQWNAGNLVLHRLVSGNAADGFIASGDNNPHSEAFERVTAANYRARVVAIYRPIQ